MKINITINNELLKKIDDYAKSKYMSRSAFLALAADTYINRENLLIKSLSENDEVKERVQEYWESQMTDFH